MVFRTGLKSMARVALAAMLFAQAVLAFAACQSVTRAPALAFKDHPADAVQCHEPESNSNLCLMHCVGDDLSLDKPIVKVPGVHGVSPFYLRPTAAPIVNRAMARRVAVPHAGAPPPRILFQSLLI